jgi:hypothetical protein
MEYTSWASVVDSQIMWQNRAWMKLVFFRKVNLPIIIIIIIITTIIIIYIIIVIVVVFVVVVIVFALYSLCVVCPLLFL